LRLEPNGEGRPFAFTECDGRTIVTLGERRLPLSLYMWGARITIFGAQEDGPAILTYVNPLAASSESEAASGNTLAPMPGTVVALLAETGALVERGTPLLTLEAMKMVHMLAAPQRGRVLRYLCAAGDFVEEGAPLVEFEAEG
jgi:3-methylcrotonyl-CoA carboxylase alpha subunit